jgi:hypothetical protein
VNSIALVFSLSMNYSRTCFFRPAKDGSSASVFVFGNGFLDLLDDVLPFSSIRQAVKVRQEFSITNDVWNARREVIRAEHRLPTARTELETCWKQRLISKGGAAVQATVAQEFVDGEMQYEEESDKEQAKA